ncbi:MAG: tetratricopeptide repeat protein [Duncaniella sp.]|nr:tetratricopeptide repeat protein [Duncaniella sp.]
MPNKQTIDLLIASGKFAEAEESLRTLIAGQSDDDSLHFALGKLLWRLGRRSEATSEYLKAFQLNPESPARIALENARQVADFFNPDLYNP